MARRPRATLTKPMQPAPHTSIPAVLATEASRSRNEGRLAWLRWGARSGRLAGLSRLAGPGGRGGVGGGAGPGGLAGLGGLAEAGGLAGPGRLAGPGGLA